MFNGLQHADRGAILMNAYVDHNDNGQRDPGEELLPDVKFKAYSPRVASTATYTPKGLLLTNIEPYQDYIATIDQKNVFEDPLYIPKYQTISITGEPNILKVVEFPVLVGGNVHGTILLKRSNGSPTPVEGIPVTIRAKSSIKEIGAPKPYTKTIKTFSTGEIQFVTVPPGTYEVFIDPTDLNLYGFKTTQSSREITVSAKPEGDQIDGVDFMLERQ